MPRRKTITLMGPMAEALILEQGGRAARSPQEKRVRLLLTLQLTSNEPEIGVKILEVLEKQGLDEAYKLLPTGRLPPVEGTG